MITKRKYLSILMMFAVLFFMFMFLQVMKESGNEYEENPYAKGSTLFSKDVHVPTDSDRDQVFFLGDTDGAIGTTVSEWCLYSKREFHPVGRVNDSKDLMLTPTSLSKNIFVIEPDQVSDEKEYERLYQLAADGNILIFCDIPELSLLRENKTLRTLMGIQRIQRESITVQGIKLFGGFLLGGESIYQAGTEEDEKEKQDLELTMPWFLLDNGCQTYMVGLMDDISVKNEQLPAVIWRSSVENGKVFSVNGPYMQECTGIGILSAMMTQSDTYSLEPVVNAQSLSVANFPGFSNENQEEMMRLYSRDQMSLFRDIIWPGLCSMAMKSDAKLTCFMSAQYNCSDTASPDAEPYPFFLKQMREQRAEAGLSLDYVSAINLSQKLAEDDAFFSGTDLDYQYRAAYLPYDQLKNFEQSKNFSYTKKLQTVISNLPYDSQIISYRNDDVTTQMITSTGIFHTFSDDLRMKSLETAIGYSNIVMDMSRISWPKSETDRWELLSEKFASNINTYWKPFQAYESTTASESDRRIRTMLALNYNSWRNKHEIHVSVDSQNTCWFLLRTHGEQIESIEGGESTQLETDAYLICKKESDLIIRLKETDSLYYTLE